jgi:hypothetical protein
MRSFITCVVRQVKEDEIVGACSTSGEKRNVYRILVEKPEGKRQLGSSRRRWEDNIGIVLRDIGCGGLIWLRIGTSGGLL